MRLRLLVPVFLQRSLLLVLCVALNSCQSHKATSGPSIEFTHIPPAAQGGRERVDTISGRVRNAGPKRQIVIYAHSGPWWVQPEPDHPFIPIQADSTWSTETHLGFEYAGGNGRFSGARNQTADRRRNQQRQQLYGMACA